MSKASLTNIFGETKPPKALLIPYARDERDGRKISLPYASLESGGDWYSESEHKGHLVCPECEAHVHFVPEVISQDGSRKNGRRPHFSTNSDSVHDKECNIGKVIEHRQAPDKDTIDYRGYRFNLNTLGNSGIKSGNLRARFNNKGAPKVKPITVNPMEMTWLRPTAIKEVGDIIRVLKSATPDEIEKSVAVWREHEVPWRRFFVGYNPSGNKDDEHKKFKNLVSGMRESGRTMQPVLIQIITSRGYTSRELDQKHCIVSKKIFVEQNSKTGPKKFIVPRLYVDTSDTRVALELQKAGEFLIMGLARLSKDPRGNDELLDISITNIAQIQSVSLKDIREQNPAVKRKLEELSPPSNV